MSHDIYQEKIRMLAAISRLSSRYVRGTVSADELNRFMKFSGDLLMAVECDQPPTLPVELPESAFAAKGKS